MGYDTSFQPNPLTDRLNPGDSVLMRPLFALAALLLSSCSQAAPSHIAWPALPTHGFIVGRTATQEDVAAGNAAFAIGSVQSTPLQIGIPQYALFKDEGKKTPVILIQAEAAAGKQLVAGRTLEGGEVVGMLSDFELLGVRKPVP